MRRLGAFDPRARRPSGAGTARGPAAGTPGGGNYEEFEFNDVGGLGGLGDIFSSIFGRGRKGEDARGETLETALEIPFRTVACSAAR
jgi:molecular chaperone DnaJ